MYCDTSSTCTENCDCTKTDGGLSLCDGKVSVWKYYVLYSIVIYSITMQPVSLVTPWINIQTVKACKHWAQCSVTAAGTAQCACIPGTSGARCENGPCAKAPCLNSGICLVVGIHAVTDIGFEDVIGLGLKIHFRFQTGSLPVLKFLIYKRSCWSELERAQL